MASQIVPTGGNQDLGPATMAIFWTETGIAILIVAARFYARTMIKGVGRDDWFMLATLVSNHTRTSSPASHGRRPDPTQKIIFTAFFLRGYIPSKSPRLARSDLHPPSEDIRNNKSEIYRGSPLCLLLRNGQGIGRMLDLTSPTPKITWAKMDHLFRHSPHVHCQLVELHH